MPSGIYQHKNKGFKHTDITKEKIRQAHKGKKLSLEHIKKLKISHTGKVGVNGSNWKGGKPKCIDCGKELSTYKKGRCQKCYGKTDEFREKCRKHTIGKKQSIKTIARRVAKNTDKKRTFEQRMRIADSQRGDKAYNWLGGLSLINYGKEWTETLKRAIRERDKYICKICDKTQIQELEDIEKKLSIHHIDYDKKNNDPKNLITLCNKCHVKTNYNRNYWIRYFELKFKT